MYLEIILLVLLLIIVILYLFFNRSTLIPIDINMHSNVESDNVIQVPFIKGI